MNNKKISDYLPTKTVDTKLLQARVNRKIYTQFKAVLKSEKQSIKAFIEASMLKFIDEAKPKKAG